MESYRQYQSPCDAARAWPPRNASTGTSDQNRGSRCRLQQTDVGEGECGRGRRKLSRIEFFFSSSSEAKHAMSCDRLPETVSITPSVVALLLRSAVAAAALGAAALFPAAVAAGTESEWETFHRSPQQLDQQNHLLKCQRKRCPGRDPRAAPRNPYVCIICDCRDRGFSRRVGESTPTHREFVRSLARRLAGRPAGWSQGDPLGDVCRQKLSPCISMNDEGSLAVVVDATKVIPFANWTDAQMLGRIPQQANVAFVYKWG